MKQTLNKPMESKWNWRWNQAGTGDKQKKQTHGRTKRVGSLIDLEQEMKPWDFRKTKIP